MSIMKTLQKLDIPIQEATILWIPKDEGGKIKIVRHPETGNKDRGMKSTGACWAVWGKMTTEEQKDQLLIDVRNIVIKDGVDPMDVHQALLVIPEYRKMLNRDLL